MIEWTLHVCRHEPEPRWFHRVVLRRKTRVVVVSVFVPENMEFTRYMNRPDTISWVSPMQKLMEYPA